MTTVLSPIEFDHLVQVVCHKACGHRAECWCGWASAWCDDYTTADAAATDHREVAAGPATGLDTTLSDLLNLQDDLADTVIWLAENWSSDFPVPQAHIRVRHLDNGKCVSCLRLLVHCATPGELVAMADLLAGPIVADAEPHQDGSRYERVTRTFGRIDIEAYTKAGGNAP
jgi:hypothetical protein